MQRKYPIELVYSDEYPFSDMKHSWGLAIGGKVMPSVYSTEENLSPAEALAHIIRNVEYWGS